MESFYELYLYKQYRSISYIVKIFGHMLHVKYFELSHSILIYFSFDIIVSE